MPDWLTGGFFVQNENVGREVHSVQYYQHSRHPGRMAPTRVLRPKTFQFRQAIWRTLFERNKISAAPLPLWTGVLLFSPVFEYLLSGKSLITRRICPCHNQAIIHISRCYPCGHFLYSYWLFFPLIERWCAWRRDYLILFSLVLFQ